MEANGNQNYITKTHQNQDKTHHKDKDKENAINLINKQINKFRQPKLDNNLENNVIKKD